MVFTNAAQLREKAKVSLLPVYLLYGEDGPQVEACARWLGKQSLDAFPDMNFSSFDGRESLDADALADAVLSMPFMAQRRCVLLDDLLAEGLGAAQAGKLWELLEAPAAETTLIITMKTQVPDPKKGGHGAKLLALCDKAGGVCPFPRLTRTAAAAYARDLAKKGGAEMDQKAAELLADYCLLDSRRMASEVDKLAAYAHGRAIGPKDVAILVTPTPDARVFDLSDKVVRGDMTGALKAVDDLLFQRETPVAVLSILAMAFVDMYRAAVACQAGATETDAKKAYGYGGGGYRYTKGMENQRKFSLQQLEDALVILADADSRMKSTGGDTRIALETAIVEVFRRLKAG